MTEQITNPSIITDSRCTHRFANGRRCRQLATDQSGTLCCDHTPTAILTKHDSADFSAELIGEGEHFQEAQQINYSLIELYRLVAAGRISPRRASVLAYIAHLILSSLKAIDYDNKTIDNTTS